MKSKKAAVQISLSWLFMIIIGTFFFVLAYNIIGNYKQVEDAKADILLKQTLRTILNDAGRTAGIEENTLIPLMDQISKRSIFQNKRVEILCEANLPIFSLNGNLDSNNEFLKNYPTFMTYIDEKDVSYSYLAVESFRMPFKITNTLAFVSKKNLIIFDKNSKISEKLLYKFRKSYTDLNYRAEKFSDLDLIRLQEEIKQNSYSSIVFVSDVGEDLPININDFNIYSSWVQIKEIGIDGAYGELNIVDNENINSKTYEYIDFDSSLNTITMAIFSKMKTFDCSYQLLVDSISPIYSFYIQKANYYENSSLKLCSSLNSISQQKIKYGILKDSLINIQDKVRKDQNINKAQELYSLLGNLNRDLLSLEDFNCPYVY